MLKGVVLNSLGQKNQTNKKLIHKNANRSELQAYLNLKYNNYKEAAIAGGISETRVRQIIIGYCLPKTAKLIKQLSDGWGINPIKLTLLFENTLNDKLDLQEEENEL